MFHFFEGKGSDAEEHNDSSQKNAFESEPSPEGIMEREPKDERLSEGEALVYQAYASQKEGIEFSERAGEGTYEEADELILRLRDAQFDFLGINWEKINLNSIADCETLNERLLAAIEILSKNHGKELPDVVWNGGHGKKFTALLTAAFLALAAFVPEKSDAADTLPKYGQTSVEKSSKESVPPYVFSPHWNKLWENGQFQWSNTWKVLLEPLAVSAVFRGHESKFSEINIPYEYARLFNSAQPLEPADFQKLSQYVEHEFLKQMSERVAAFSWDKEALAERNPDALQVKEVKISNVHVQGSASPEGRSPESLKSGNVDPENEKLAELRAGHAREAFEQILKKHGAQYDPTDFTVGGIEEQLTTGEEKVLELLADKYHVDPFELVKQYNAGGITDESDKKAMDEMFAGKRQVMITFDREGEAPSGVIIPLPLLLLLLLRRRNAAQGQGAPGHLPPSTYWNLPLPRFGIQWHDVPWRIPLPNIHTRPVDVTVPVPEIHGSRFPLHVPVPDIQLEKVPVDISVPSPKINWQEFSVKVPWPKFERRDVVIERFDWRELEDDQLEKYKLDVFCDIAQNTELYEGIARRYVDVDLSGEEESVGHIASHILTMWEDMDNQREREAGTQRVHDYFSDSHQKFYAELHAVVVRSLTLRMQRGQFLSQKRAEMRVQLEAMIAEEFERYRK